MAVNPSKARNVLVVHGVQYGKSKKAKQHIAIKELIENRLGTNELNFKTELFPYEDINDKSQQLFKRLNDAIFKTAPQKLVTNLVIDVVGDVIVNLIDGPTAKSIRDGLKEKIISIYERGEPCYIVAHSLGTIYAFDVIKELMSSPEYFDRASRKTWPVQGFLTIGSPIGLTMFNKKRKTIKSLGKGTKFFRWINYWDRTDPIVSGDVFGKSFSGFKIAEKYLQPGKNQGWIIRDKPIDTGKVWLGAHTAYWENPTIGDDLVDLIAN